jgi:hypothetical protein
LTDRECQTKCENRCEIEILRLRFQLCGESSVVLWHAGAHLQDRFGSFWIVPEQQFGQITLISGARANSSVIWRHHTPQGSRRPRSRD